MPYRAKILIVDDEARICGSLTSLLSQQGYEIHTAKTGCEAKSLIGKIQFDIALLDQMLPDMHGHELIKEIKKKSPDAEAIIMTGNASINSAIAALRKGAYDYLRKPFEVEELTHTIKNALSQKQLKRENKKVLNQLAVSQRHYRYLVDNSPDIIYTLNEKGVFTFANNSMEDLIGLKSCDIIGQHYSKIVGKNNTQKSRWIINERRTGERTKSWDELKLIKFDVKGKPKKEVMFAELQSTGMYKKTNPHIPKAYVGTHGVIRDISARKRFEQKNNQIKSQLQRAEKMEAIGTLASGVAHDLNNILSSVLGYPELILMEMPKEDPNREHILQIQKSGEKAAVIVKDLLTLARRGVEICEVVNLDSIICDYFTSPEYLKLKSNYPKIALNINLNSNQQNIMGSPVHLSKCLMNILSNAAEAMPFGGQINISTQTCNVSAIHLKNKLQTPEQYIKLTITDSGIGISPKDLKRIFDPFYTKKQMGRSGTGLGMTIVWTTVQDHKGHIDVQSQKGKGTTFALYFPVTKTREKEQAKFDIDSIKGNGESILIVDDMQDQQALASDMLSALGYTVSCVTTGQEAIDFIKVNKADLILLDMVLGTNFDGLKTYNGIKKQCPAQKVILVSGLSKTGRIKTALKNGVRQYIKKPYTMKTIGIAISQELDPVP
ncbi:MAG: response regulator [Desulfobacula sp.]|nr:response regulator [Desulfobacula sp.]